MECVVYHSHNNNFKLRQNKTITQQKQQYKQHIKKHDSAK